MKKVVGNSQYQKVANALLILRLLRKGANTRVAIARELGLQPSTVTYSVNRLLEVGLVQESNTSVQNGAAALGRKAVSIELNRDAGRVIGLELLADSGWASILDSAGTVLYSEPIEYPNLEHLSGRKRFEYLVKQVIDHMVQRCLGLRVLGVGIALPGIVEANAQVVRDCWTHELKECDFSDFFTHSFDFPVVLENDANCCAQRYLFDECTEKQDNFIYVLARTYEQTHVPLGVSPFGIGLGLVFGGTLYRGSSSRSGEFMSAMLPLQEVGKQLSASVDDVDDLKSNADKRQTLLAELSANIRSIIAILDPQVTYLGGFLAEYEQEVLDTLKDQLVSKIHFSDAHNDASEGAAVHILSLLYRIPQVGDTSSEQWRLSTLLWDALA